MLLNKMNCWEFMKCGRQLGGGKDAELGICPVSIDSSQDGINGGKNAGRICWTVYRTPCAEAAGMFKMLDCVNCDFFKKSRRKKETISVLWFWIKCHRLYLTLSQNPFLNSYIGRFTNFNVIHRANLD